MARSRKVQQHETDPPSRLALLAGIGLCSTILCAFVGLLANIGQIWGTASTILQEHGVSEPSKRVVLALKGFAHDHAVNVVITTAGLLLTVGLAVVTIRFCRHRLSLRGAKYDFRIHHLVLELKHANKRQRNYLIEINSLKEQKKVLQADKKALAKELRQKDAQIQQLFRSNLKQLEKLHEMTSRGRRRSFAGRGLIDILARFRFGFFRTT